MANFIGIRRLCTYVDVTRCIRRTGTLGRWIILWRLAWCLMRLTLFTLRRRLLSWTVGLRLALLLDLTGAGIGVLLSSGVRWR